MGTPYNIYEDFLAASLPTHSEPGFNASQLTSIIVDQI